MVEQIADDSCNYLMFLPASSLAVLEFIFSFST